MSLLLKGGALVSADYKVSVGDILISDDGKIATVGSISADRTRRVEAVVDASGMYVAPGFVDIHVHGGNNCRFDNSPTIARVIANYSSWIASRGVTGFLCTLMCPTKQELIRAIARYVQAFESCGEGAECLGLHLEGPFVNGGMLGAMDPAWIRPPDMEEAREIVDVGRGWIRQITIAPELDGASELAPFFRKNGVVVSLGHSDASYEVAKKALDTDFCHVTHVFNAQRGFNHREPGVVGAVLNSQKATMELIADKVHVHPGAIELLLSHVGTGRISLITDATDVAGLSDGTYNVAGREMIVRDGGCRTSDGTLAGSVITLDQCVRNMRAMGASVAGAISMASHNPVAAMGLQDRMGSIAAGKYANLVVLDDDLMVRETIVRGRLVYSSERDGTADCRSRNAD